MTGKEAVQRQSRNRKIERCETKNEENALIHKFLFEKKKRDNAQR